MSTAKSESRATFVDVGQIAGAISEAIGAAYSRGATEARHFADHQAQLLKDRETVIQAQQGTINALNDKLVTLTDKVGDLTRQTSEIVLLTAHKDLAIERVRASAKQNAEILALLAPVRDRLLAGGLTGGKGSGLPPEVRRAFEKVLADDALCARIQETVGTDDFQALLAWAASQ